MAKDEEANALDEDFFIRNAIYCWLYYFKDHKWRSIYEELGQRETYTSKPQQPKPRRTRRTTQKPAKEL